MALKKPKAKGGKKVKTRADKRKEAAKEALRKDQESEDDENEDEADVPAKSPKVSTASGYTQLLSQPDDKDIDDPYLTIPMPRYNAMLAVLRHTLYM
jgi:hypothetical protein